MEPIDLLPRSRAERDHAPVAYRRVLFVERLAYPEGKLANAAVLVETPTRCHAIPFGIARNTALHSQRSKGRFVKADRSRQIIGPEVNVSQHRGASEAGRWH